MSQISESQNPESQSSKDPSDNTELLKIVVVVLGVMLVIGFIVVIGTIIIRLSGLPSSSETMESTIDLPAGAVIRQVDVDERTISFMTGEPGTEMLLVYDVKSGALLRKISVSRQKP